jgi:hypothetical protein
MDSDEDVPVRAGVYRRAHMRRDPSGRLHRMLSSIVLFDGTEMCWDSGNERFLIFYSDGCFVLDDLRARCSIRMRSMPDGTVEMRFRRWRRAPPERNPEIHWVAKSAYE